MKSKIDLILYITLLLIIILHILLLIYRWEQPILGMHGFRQTQTALSTYWLLNGGHWFSYETPVIGAPWSIPFEFPFYQWCVALTKTLTQLPLDFTGRLVNLLFLFLTLLACYSLFQELELKKTLFPIFAILLLSSPLYMFWSSTFMIESCALFFAVSFLFFLQKYLHKPSVWNFTATTLLAVLGIVIKVTTFTTFAYLGIILIILNIISNWRKVFNSKLLFSKYLPITFIFLAAFAAISLWANFADDLKEQNLIGQYLTSKALQNWHFGNLETRFSEKLWLEIVFGRSLNQAIGFGSLIFFLAGLLLFCDKKTVFASLIALSAYITTFLLFPILHIRHNYYQYANSIFIIFAAAAIIAGLQKDRIKTLILLVIVCLQFVGFYHSEYYKELFIKELKNHRTLKVAHVIREKTPEESAILVLGVGWSSEVAYYSQRRAITLPNWVSKEKKRIITTNPKKLMGGLPISAIVVCGDTPYDINQRKINRFISNAEAHKVNNCAVHIRKDR